MSISSEITRISNAKTAIAQSITNKGVTVPSGTKIDGMATLIDSIQTGGGGGDTSETWVLNPVVTIDNTLSVAISFTSNGQSFSLFHFDSDRLKYDDTSATSTPDIGSPTVAMKLIYRKVTFAAAPAGGLLTWLEANGVKQASDTAVQPSKSLTVTSNGTTTITPGTPYDAIKQVDLTVNVATVSRVTINCEANDSFAFWLSPDGVFHDIKLNAGANTITVALYSPIGVYNTYGHTLTNRKNIVDSGGVLNVRIQSTSTVGYFHIYYATDIRASATQPTD